MNETGFLAAGLVTTRLAGTNAALTNTKRSDGNTREHPAGTLLLSDGETEAQRGV